MKVTLIPARSLDAALVQRWAELQDGNSELASPYFTPEFTQAVAAVRNDVEVAVIEQNGETAAFFPFQRETTGNIGKPLAGILSDFQGLICKPGFECDPRQLARQCGLKVWDFDHLLASQRFFTPFHRHYEPSPQIDLAGGYEAYVRERRDAGSEQIKKCGNLMRRIEREIGVLSFIAHSGEVSHLRQVLEWKSKQYLAGGNDDLFVLDWTRAMVEKIQATQTRGCAGMLSLLYAGERLIAGHFGMRSRTVWHYWFPAYDEAMAKYSPGLILLLKMAEHAPQLGISKIDLGKGMSLYKERLMNGSVRLAAGSVELLSLRSLRSKTERAIRGVISATRLAGPVRRLVDWMRRPKHIAG